MPKDRDDMYLDTQLSASSLFHYTPTLDNLKGILRSGDKGDGGDI
jgi:hypothetical protein